MRNRLRWLVILVPVVVVAALELVSDGLLDEALPFPADVVAVVLVVAALSTASTWLVFRRIDTLTEALARRNEELQARVASARALHLVSVAVAALADVDRVFRVIVDSARELLRTDVALLFLADADGALQFRTGGGPVEAFLVDRRSPGGPTGAGGGPGAAGGDLDGIESILRHGIAAASLASPLRRGDETIGLLAVASRASRSFTVDDVETLASLANQAAIALENDRLQARLRDLAVSGERERIAREMHDGLAQVLGYVNTKSQAIDEYLAAGRPREARGQLAELAAAARSLYVDVRETILGLRSPIVGERGLVRAVEDYVARFSEAAKLPVEVGADDESRNLALTPAIQAHAFRIVQEALTNVRKHAAAQRVRVAIELRDGTLVIRITDDGRGFGRTEATASAGWPHYGLPAMAERAASIGASVTWSDLPEGGACVELCVPVVATVSRDGGSSDATASRDGGSSGATASRDGGSSGATPSRDGGSPGATASRDGGIPVATASREGVSPAATAGSADRPLGVGKVGG